ncbi:MAG: serine/arginine repetitive matrix protein 2 [Acidipropionibacterium jensenii]|nr:serine/arginine repetitive matrix protein 2 [Acidipropionibacterium acidipropionici]MDN6618964.1 serine/arginine repetitive matrix protein 2 [Corynebacterium variabile]MDN6659342.1 serine/arginine repetitive matrix protein 2 [Acidipropionibacterium jensenii]MDN6812771.1 serine/arginine repetitive matrix protein 2 [Corynebacterium variabile]
MATTEEARAARDAKLDELHERLAGAVEQLVSGDDWRRALEFAARFRAKSFNNTLLIWAQHLDLYESGRTSAPEPTFVAGYKQWKALGRSPLAGGSMQIFAPLMARFASSTPQNPDSWRRLDKFEKPKPGETVRSKMVRAIPVRVWDVSMTNGPPIPERPTARLLEGEAPSGLWEGLEALVEADGYRVLRVEHEGIIRGANGLTDFAARTVAVRTNMDPAAQVKTLAHELGNVRLHGPDNPDWAKHRGIGEVEAESVALMIGAAHGMDTSSYSVSYVSGWAGTVKDKEPAEVVQATGERVRKTAAAILDALETVQLGGGDPPGLTREAAPRAERMRPAFVEQTRAVSAAHVVMRSL